MTTAQLITELARRLDAHTGNRRIELHLENGIIRRTIVTTIHHARDLEHDPDDQEHPAHVA